MKMHLQPLPRVLLAAQGGEHNLPRVAPRVSLKHALVTPQARPWKVFGPLLHEKKPQGQGRGPVHQGRLMACSWQMDSSSPLLLMGSPQLALP